MQGITDEQVRWLGASMVARMLANAADPQRRGQMLDAIRYWFPGVTPLELEREDLPERIAKQFLSIANLVDIRTRKLAEEDPPRSVPLEGCELIP